MKKNQNEVPSFVELGVELGNPNLGTEIIDCSDDFFADRHRLLNPDPPVFIEGKYDDHGKWMDGWESRRRRNNGHDYLVIKLGQPSILFGVNIDTSFFTGNFPSAASLEGTYCDTELDDNTEWVSLINITELEGDSHHLLEIDNRGVWTHLRFNIFPDGGVARLRLYGRIFCDWEARDKTKVYDLACILNGGRAIGWNDAHFGHPSNMLSPGDGRNMGDSWETRRRREPGFDWCVIELGYPCLVEEIIVDTSFFIGNFPDSFSIQAASIVNSTRQSLVTQSIYWEELLPSSKLEMNMKNRIKVNNQKIGAINYIRLNIFPDGGVSRLRVLGKMT